MNNSNWVPATTDPAADRTFYQPEPSNTQPSATPTKRARISRACDTCRKKKIKCDVDSQHPCSTCKQYDWSCTFNDTAKKRGPPKGYIESLEQRLKRMEELLGRLQPADEHASPTQTPNGRDESPAASSPIDSEQQTTSKDKVVRYLGSSSGMYLVNDILKANHDRSNPNSPTQHPQPSTPPTVNNGTPPIQTTHIPSPSESYTALSFNNSTITLRAMNQYEDDMVLVREETESEAKQHQIHATQYGQLTALVPRTIQEALVKIYFEYPCTTLPVLDHDTFMRSFDSKDPNPISPLLVCAVCSYACYLVPTDHPIFQKSELPRDKVFDIFMARAIQCARSSYLLPQVETVQALVLLCAHPTHAGESYRNWIWSGMAVRMAQDLGLHRTVESCDPKKRDVLETRRLLWFSVYITDRWCCAAMGRPLAIADSDCDVELPNVDMPNEPGKYGMFVNLIKLSGILGEVLRRIYSPKAKSVGYQSALMEQTVLGLDRMLQEWYESVPAEFRITHEQLQSMKGFEYTQIDRFRSGGPLTLCYYAVVILLFRPFLVLEALPSSSFSNLHEMASRRCLEAARRAIDVARHVPIMDITRYGWNFAAYSVFQASLVHIYHCTSSDMAIAQTEKDYTRISMKECIIPMTKDFPSYPPVAQFLMNLLVLMKADPDLIDDVGAMSSANDKMPLPPQQQDQPPQPHQQQHAPSSGKNTLASANTTPPIQPSTRPPVPVMPTASSAQDLASTTNDLPSVSPMSVQQIVSNGNLSLSAPMSTSVPVVAPLSMPPPQPQQQAPWDLLSVALNQGPMPNNASNMVMTPATWQYLFSTAGVPFSTNTNNLSNLNPADEDGSFMDASGPFM
ncbi:hypothetical protein DM01DRAFT_1386434 [Hesseltinella vesiculosa]|uniref:Zn(2)-C6 fungal-type domain-containing protein n=1 Tax=Hesseltinella vesiculosa TaxID=101127 RepID=A0A1X2G5Y6_9FUNG|nr:hypothetical protein DM01DRAFT_1386434 [Hesseltinella vesiculosa]